MERKVQTSSFPPLPLPPVQAALELAVNKTFGRVLETQYLKETLSSVIINTIVVFSDLLSHPALKIHVAEDTLSS